MTIRPFVFSLAFCLLGVSGRVLADPAQGRPSAQVPVGPNITQAADASGGGNMYESQRIKRTVSLDAAGGLDGKWDPLYVVQDGSGGARTSYLDWDDNYLYIGIETPTAAEARVDIDGQNDGWLRGADNLSIVVTPAAEGSTDPPRVIAQRFDMAQNKEAPVWAASPILPSEIKASGAKTPRGTYALVLAIPRTEEIGLARKPGSAFGIRVETGAPTLPASASEAVSIPVRPMLRVTLTESAEASFGGLNVRLLVNGPHNVTQGQEVRTTLEIKNTSAARKRFTRLFIRGSLNGADNVDESKSAGVDVEPGQTIKRELRSSVAPAAPTGALVFTGGGDLDDGNTVAALLSFNKVEPYYLYLETDNRPIPGGGENGKDPVRQVRVFVGSRVNKKTVANVTIQLPEGWKLDSGAPNTTVTLVRDGDVELTKYNFVVPASAKLGAHTLRATVEVGGHSYTASKTVVIAQ